MAGECGEKSRKKRSIWVNMNDDFGARSTCTEMLQATAGGRHAALCTQEPGDRC
jgi:hypothetical protein